MLCTFFSYFRCWLVKCIWVLPFSFNSCIITDFLTHWHSRIQTLPSPSMCPFMCRFAYTVFCIRLMCYYCHIYINTPMKSNGYFHTNTKGKKLRSFSVVPGSSTEGKKQKLNKTLTPLHLIFWELQLFQSCKIYLSVCICLPSSWSTYISVSV